MANTSNQPISSQPLLPYSAVPAPHAPRMRWTGFANKTLWDWLQLLAALAVPLALGLATYSFNVQQADLAQNQHKIDQQTAADQHTVDRQSTIDQQREASLQSYLDRMSDLLLGNNTGRNSPSLGTAHPDDQISQVARARTLTVLRSLDGRRKGIVLQFLYDAKLLHPTPATKSTPGTTPIVELHGADLSSASLSESANLSGADLSGADLSGALFTREVNLSGADLSGANLSEARLAEGVNLSGANLSNVNLSEARLAKGVNLSNANLSNANLSNANLSNANLTSATLTGLTDLTNAILKGADFSSANLVGAVLQKADLSGTEMWHANLYQTDLSNTNLSGADLDGANITTSTYFNQAIYTSRTHWPSQFNPQGAHAVKTDVPVLPAFVDFSDLPLHYHLANVTLKTNGFQLNQNSLLLGNDQQVVIEFDLQRKDLAQIMVTVNGLVSQHGPNNQGFAPINLQLNGHPAFVSSYTIPGGGYQPTSQSFSAPSAQLVAGENTLTLTVDHNAVTNFWLSRLEVGPKSS